MKRVQFKMKLLHPRYWLSWFGIGLWWLLVQSFPFRLQIFLGNQLGDLLVKYGGSRRNIAQRNIERCYPNHSEKEKFELLREVLRSTAIGIFESGAAWFWPNWRIKKHFRLIGYDHLQAVEMHGKGVLFMGIHFTSIEMGAAFVNTVTSIDGFYRPHKNAVYEYVQARGRIHRNRKSQVIPNGDVRGIVKALRGGHFVNYAPDQDYGRKRSVFVPFLGVQAATVKAPAQLAKAGNAEIVPWVARRRADGGHEVEIYAPITSLLGKGDIEDANTMNRFIEARVNETPEQYLWVHRRFKTRPEGEEPFYKGI
ncbi:LpxL/LpxP family Kdo(2)-lipid IV(A) lauroyl/palmitoleoyl acyltransferase [Teredinibacter haidensis]|uniref:LpxL/LpxP family Kdo(2)-lipid IV(A) lauroyl/palmitoleoyl acyltransferase n=1 Tax=Teredinibacter haidensis TaxID=2731755 RepID=UPI0009491120|nr:LpxL/LpxP family Kdo(2)-lipid IV(A) lauroyl/palmitoleoyl acyltransferase [Teredinibacter haidensis]